MHETLAFVDLIEAGNAQAQLLLYAIARHADSDTGACEVSQSVLARMGKCSLRTCRNYLAKLEEDNLISRAGRFDEAGARLSDEITLVGYQGWISTIRKGGVVQAPRIINSYERAANLADTPPANSAGYGSLKDQDNLDTPPANLAAPPGKQVAAYKEINNKLINNKYSLSVSENFYQQLIEAAAPCLDNPETTLGLMNEGTPQSWISEGADLELDILPTLRACAKKFEGKKIQSWNYFTQPILAQKQAREAVVRIPNKKNAEATTVCGFEDQARVYFHGEKLKLCDALNQEWLPQFNGSQDDLNLALIQIAAYIQPNSTTRSLEAQVSSQLARITRDRRDRDRRYHAAVKNKPPNGKTNSYAPSKKVSYCENAMEIWEKIDKGELT